MSIDEIDYFSRVKSQAKWDYQLARNAELLSAKDPQDKLEFERRVAILASHKKPSEATRQVISFISEVEVFNIINDSGNTPHWVPESTKQGIKAPDIFYERGGNNIPVEVKTLHLTKEEFDIWAKPGTVLESGPDWDYFEGCKIKLDSFFKDTFEKFRHYADGDINGELYLVYLPGTHVRLRDGEDGQPLMPERIQQYAKEKLGARIKFTLINSMEKW